MIGASFGPFSISISIFISFYTIPVKPGKNPGATELPSAHQVFSNKPLTKNYVDVTYFNKALKVGWNFIG